MLVIVILATVAALAGAAKVTLDALGGITDVAARIALTAALAN
ncbi:hypothetical protein [Streptomyces hydrogenans]